MTENWMTVRQYAEANGIIRGDRRYMQAVGHRASILCETRKITPLPREIAIKRWSQAYPPEILEQAFKGIPQ